jgi:hypothetical protein
MEVEVRVPGGFCGRWWHDADRACAQETFNFFLEKSVGTESGFWGESAEWTCGRCWHDTDRATHKKNFTFFEEAAGQRSLRESWG